MANFNQIYNLVNAITNEKVGGESITVKDTSTLVSLGKKILSSSDNVDEFYKKLPDVIGRITTHYQAIRRHTRGIERTPIDFGIAVLEYERHSIARAKKNNSWGEQVNPFTIMTKDDTDIDVNIYSVISGWELNKITYDEQLKTAFHNEAEMANFLGMIFQDMYDGMTNAQNDTDAICECTAMAQSLIATTTDNPRMTAFNLFTEYKAENPSTTLTAATCRKNSDFLKFAGSFILNKIDDAKSLSNLFNVGGAEVELDEDFKIHMLSEFASNMAFYLQADTYHNELVSIKGFEKITAWQGLGNSDTFDEKSSIAVTNDDITVVQSGIVCHVYTSGRMFTMIDRIRTKSLYNPASELTNWYHKADIGMAIRRNDIGIVFYIADTDFTNNFLNTLTVNSKISNDIDLLGKTVNDLQKNIKFNGNKVTGTLKYVTGYTGYSGDVSEQSGNYLAIHAELFGIPSTVSPTITVSANITSTLDDDGLCIIRCGEDLEAFTVTASAEGYTTKTITFDLTGLTKLES